MNAKRMQESSQTAGRALSLPALVVAIFLTLHIIPLFWRPIPMWGVDFLCYLPTTVQVAFFLLVVLLFVPRFQHLCRTCVTSLPIALWGKGRRVWLSRAFVALIALAGFILLSSSRHFLGDGYRLMQAPGADKWTSMLRAPLTYTIVQTLHNIGSAIWETVENTYRTYSYASGVLYVLFAFPIANILGKNTLERAVVLAFLLTAGYIQFFFGYVENYALYMPGLLLYLYLGLRTCKDRAPLFLPAFLMGFLLALHRGFFIFGPSILFLAYRGYRRGRYRIPTWKNALATAAGLCCVPASALFFFAVTGVGVHDYFFRAGGNHLLPLFDDPGFGAQYRIFSFTHIIDWLNQYLLAAPAACMALFLIRKKDLSLHPFLAFCTVVPLFFSFVGNSELGAFRDWDAWSLPAPPLTLWVAAVVLNRIRDGTDLSRGAFLICGAAALHTCLWVGMNASAAAAEARFVHLAEQLKGGASVDAWMAVGNVRRQEKRYPEALHAHKQACDANPADPNRWLLVGTVYREMGQSANAIEYYKKAQQLQPDLAMPYMNLGAAYNDLDQFDKAIEYTRKAIALQPDLATAHANLGAMYIKTGQFDKAIEHLERARELQPREPSIYANLGVVYNITRQHANAIRALEKAVALGPDDAVAYGNLGAVYATMGQFDSAIQYLEKAVELRPDYSRAHKNLGLVYKAQGRYQEAIGHFEKVLELHQESVSATVYLDIGDLYYRLREYEKAIPYFNNAIQHNRNHASAHLLLGMSYRALKRGDLASIHFEKTLELEPDHPQAAQIRQWLKQIRE